MSKSIKIFIPLYARNPEEVYFVGHLVSSYNTTTIYLTKSCTGCELPHNISVKYLSVYAYCGENFINEKFLNIQNNIIINKDRTILKQLTLNGQPQTTSDIIILQYDYTKMRDSQTITDTADASILHLQKTILEENGLSQKFKKHSQFFKIPYWLACSMFLQHICNYLNLVKWLMDSVRRDKKVKYIVNDTYNQSLTDSTSILHIILHKNEI